VRIKHLRGALLSALIVFAMILSIIIIDLPTVSATGVLYTPSDTIIDVQQGQVFLLRHTLQFNQPAYGGYFAMAISWDVPSSDENFTLENAPSVYWTSGGSGVGNPVENVTFDNSATLTGWQVTAYISSSDKNYYDGTFNVDFWLRAANQGTPHQVGLENNLSYGAGICIVEQNLLVVAEDNVAVNVSENAKINYISGLCTNDLARLIFPDEPVELEFSGIVTEPGVPTINFAVSNLLHENSGTADVIDNHFSFNGTLYEGYNTITVNVSPQDNTTLILLHDTSPPGIAINFPSAQLSYMKEKTEEFNGAGQKVGDQEKLTTYYPDGKIMKEEENITDKYGNKIGDLHITYEYDGKSLVKKIIDTTDKDGNVTKEENVEADKITTIIPGPGNDLDHPTEVNIDLGYFRDSNFVKTGDQHWEYHYYTSDPQMLHVSNIYVKYTNAAGDVTSDEERHFDYISGWRISKESINYTNAEGRWTGVWILKTYKYHDPPLKRVESITWEEHGLPGLPQTIPPTIPPTTISKITKIEYDGNNKAVKITEEWRSDGTLIGSKVTFPEYGPHSVENEVVNFWDNETGTLRLVQTRDTTYEYGFNSTLLTDRTMTVVLSDLSFDPGIRAPEVVDIFVTIHGPTENTFYATSLLDTSTFNLEIPPDATDVTVIAMDEAGNTQVGHVYLPPPSQPVGGIAFPADKLALLAPYIVLAALIAIVAVSVTVYWRRQGGKK
jgi:hypothetical protein